MHISSLSNKFVDDPHTVVKAGDIVQVKVMEVDLQRKRIALTMRLDEQPREKRQRGGGTIVRRATARRRRRLNRAAVRRSQLATAP